MKITELTKKVHEAEVMLDANDIETIISEHFQRAFNAKASELSFTYEEPKQKEIQVSYRRVEIVK